MDYKDLIAALAARYEHPRYAFFSEVGNAVGFPSSRLDALAMAMWRSLGLEVHGFEIKLTRSDWLREKRQPFKNEDLYSYCDRWWLVLGDKDIVKDGELPPTWGLLLPRGKSLVLAVKAPQLTPTPLDRVFVASILRKAFHAEKHEVRWQRRPQNTAEELEQAKRSIRTSLDNVERRLDRLRYQCRGLQREIDGKAQQKGVESE